VAEIFEKNGPNAVSDLDKKWSSTQSKRVSSYMKLYQSFASYETFFLIAHRNFVSIFDISNEVWRHIEYNDQVRFIGITLRNNKKEDYAGRISDFKYSDKYKASVIVGANQLHFLHIDERFNRFP
jgi:hypothetical protein